jgi:membrane fusion protein (multidrug efflux system)
MRAIVVFVTVVAVSACNSAAGKPSGSADAAAGTAAAPAPQASPAATGDSPVVNVVQVVSRPLDVTLEMPGELEAYEDVAMFPRVAGYVKSINVDRGSRVAAGEVLATLEAPELLSQRAEAESKVQAAEAQRDVVRAKSEGDASTFDRLKAASATPGVVAGNDLTLAQKTLEADRSQLAAAEKNVEAARQALSSVTQVEGYLRVTAPFAGIVTERNVHPGALVGPNSGGAPGVPMLRIVNRDRLRLVVPVPEAYLAGISEGVEMPFTVPAYPGETFKGKVARVAHAVDVKTRTMAVEIDVANRGGRLAPGGFCQVRWPVRRKGPSLLVPTGSVTSTTGRTFVIRVRDGKTEWVDVKTGIGAGPLVEVFGDLKAGDEVAARGTDELRPGSDVKTKVVQLPS